MADEDHAPEGGKVPLEILFPQKVLLELGDGHLPRPLPSLPDPPDPERVSPRRAFQVPSRASPPDVDVRTRTERDDLVEGAARSGEGCRRRRRRRRQGLLRGAPRRSAA
eukprot:16427607-Heterocapsa_arctica.AAC.1